MPNVTTSASLFFSELSGKVEAIFFQSETFLPKFHTPLAFIDDLSHVRSINFSLLNLNGLNILMNIRSDGGYLEWILANKLSLLWKVNARRKLFFMIFSMSEEFRRKQTFRMSNFPYHFSKICFSMVNSSLIPFSFPSGLARWFCRNFPIFIHEAT